MLMPIGDDLMTRFENSLAWAGVFTNMPTPRTYVNVNKKVAMQAKRMGQDDWQFACSMCSSPKYNQSKVARGQLDDPFLPTHHSRLYPDLLAQASLGERLCHGLWRNRCGGRWRQDFRRSNRQWS